MLLALLFIAQAAIFRIAIKCDKRVDELYPSPLELTETRRHRKVSAALVKAGIPIANVYVWIHDLPKKNLGIAGVSAKDSGR